MNQFEATGVTITEDEGVLIIGITDSIKDPVHWVVLQKELHPSEADAALGFSACYVESSELESPGYEAIKSYKIESSLITLFSDGDMRLPKIKIHLKINESDLARLKIEIAKCFYTQ